MVFSVEFDDSIDQRRTLDTSEINTETIWVRARLIKTFNAAFSAKKMFCLAGAETVRSEVILTAYQGEIGMLHKKMLIIIQRANRTITGPYLHVFWRFEFESNQPTVTASCKHQFYIHDNTPILCLQLIYGFGLKKIPLMSSTKPLLSLSTELWVIKLALTF